MTITVQIPHDIEMKIHDKISRGDTKAVRQLLLDAIAPKIIETWLNKNMRSKLANDEFEMLADQLADRFRAYVGQNFPPLSDYAVSREGIYEDSWPS